MSGATIVLILISIFIIYITIRLRRAENKYKKPLVISTSPETKDISNDFAVSSLSNPFIIFNEVKISDSPIADETSSNSSSPPMTTQRPKQINLDKFYTVLKGEEITKNCFIIQGTVGVYLRDELLHILRDGNITFNCFDLFRIKNDMRKIALSSCTVSELPPGNSFVNLVILEKTLFIPAIKFFKIDLLKIDSFPCRNFSEFLTKKLSFKDRPERKEFQEDTTIDLSERIVHIERGELEINGAVHYSSTVVGYLGLFFNCCNMKHTVKAKSGTAIEYVQHSSIGKRREFDPSLLQAIPDDLLRIGATSAWIRLNPNAKLVTKGCNANEIFLIEREVLGCKELISETAFTDDYTVEKITDAIRIPQKTIDYMLQRDFRFFKSFTREIFKKDNLRSKILLITPSMGSCQDFVVQLNRTISNESIVINKKDIFAVVRNHRLDRVGELLLSEYLLRLKEKYRVIIVYIENDWSRMLRFFSSICDIIFVVGREPVKNRFLSRNVEFVQLHEELPTLKTKGKLRRLLFDPDSTDDSSLDSSKVTGKISIDPLGSDKISVNTLASDHKSDNFVSKNQQINPELQINDNKGTRLRKSESFNTDSIVRSNDGTVDAVKSPSFRYEPSPELVTVRREFGTDEPIKGNPSYRRVHHILFPEKSSGNQADLDRMKRYLLDERIGLVLGGGGALGFAHIGVLKALEEENIPVDCIGGTSMGAFVGALYARHPNFLYVYSQSKRLSRSLSSFWTYLIDFTFPVVSLFSGRGLSSALRGIFGDSIIQTLWLEFYCVTTNLLKQEESIHFNGKLWKYLRASMSICGYLPPVFIKNEVLADGAYTNNVPVDVMKSLNIEKIIAVDVGSTPEAAVDPYDSSSGLILLFKKYFASKKYLFANDIQYRLAFISTEKKAKLLERDSLLIRPDLYNYKVSDFKNFDEIISCGYESAKRLIKEWKGKGLLSKSVKKERRNSI